MAKKSLSSKKKRQLTLLTKQATDLARKGQHLAAIKLCDKADVIMKDDPETMYVRGMVTAMQDDYETASRWMEQACKAMPKRLDCLVNLAGCLLLSKQQEKAAEIYPQILEKDPKLFERANGYSAYGSLLEDIGEYREAMQMFDRAITHVETMDIEVVKKAASLYNEFGHVEKAVSLLQQARKISPLDPAIPYDIGAFLMQQGKKEEARTLLRESLEIKPDFAEALALLVMSGEYDGLDNDLAKLHGIYQKEEIEDHPRILAAFNLGRVADKSGKYDEAFGFWSEGNRLRRKHMSIDEDRQDRLHQAIIDQFPASRFTSASNGNACQEEPIFIVGMPRCGSTLLERALSRHPDLEDAGEIEAMLQSVAGRKLKARETLIIERLETYSDNELLAVGAEYVRRLLNEYGVDGRAVDKTLSNYLYAGIIAIGLPRARIIHLIREPMASCLSMFQENFASGVNYAYDLEELGRQYARYQKLMKHWRDALPQGVMLEVSYEDLVSNTEDELRKVLEFCNLEWNDACLETHKAKGSVTTASIFQVRQPIHQKSVARWKHYEKQLEPLKKHLLSAAVK